MDKYFRCWIHPLSEMASQGKWDWRVVVQRLTDGVTKTLKVGGGWEAAESCARRMMQDLLVGCPCHGTDPCSSESPDVQTITAEDKVARCLTCRKILNARAAIKHDARGHRIRSDDAIQGHDVRPVAVRPLDHAYGDCPVDCPGHDLHEVRP